MASAFSASSTFGFLGGSGFCGTIPGCPAPATVLGVVLQSAIGYFLSARAKKTVWRGQNDKCTPFAFESILLPFQAKAEYGAEVLGLIPRLGDLLHWLYLVLDRKAITARQIPSEDRRRQRCVVPYPSGSVCNPCCDPKQKSCCNLTSDPFCSAPGCCTANTPECTGLRGPYCNYVDEFGFAVLLRCAFSVNGQVIDCLFNHYLHCWEALSGKPGKRLEEMIGKRYTRAQLVADSQQDCRLYVPLPFYFTEHSGEAFPLISCQFAPVQVHCHFAPLCKLIQVSDCDVEPVLCRTQEPIKDCDMKACLQGTYVQLDIGERDRFALGTFNQLITYVQPFTCVTNTGYIQAPLSFVNPCIELIWCVQRKCAFDKNETFNYAGAHGRDPIEFCSLSICGLTRFAREGGFFRKCTQYETHTRVARDFVYCYSFSVDPEGCNNTGYFDLTRVVDAKFACVLQEEIRCQNNQLFLFCRAFDVCHFGKGTCRALFH